MNTTDKIRRQCPPPLEGLGEASSWKENWEESKKHYLDWWDGKGIVLSMWEHLQKDGVPHELVAVTETVPPLTPVVAVIEVPVELPLHPEGNDQLYDVAFATEPIV